MKDLAHAAYVTQRTMRDQSPNERFLASLGMTTALGEFLTTHLLERFDVFH
jgi:hypothetical protein